MERAFGGIRSLLFEYLVGYMGVDIADRGADPHGDAILSVSDLERLIQSWAVKIWQNRVLGEYCPSWDPGGKHSPNTLFAAAMAQGGFAVQIPDPESYYELLPVHYVSRAHAKRGVKIRGLWYDGPELDPCRDQPSARGGAHRRRWMFRRDPRDARQVYFQDPRTHEWAAIRWTGLTDGDDVPSFGDGRVRELLATARDAGLRPRTDRELLPLLLELIGGAIPVDRWPTQLSKQDRRQHAREARQETAVKADHPMTSEHPAARDVVIELDVARRAKQAGGSVDAERRRRREQAVAQRPESPPSLHEALKRRSIFAIPPDDEEPT